MRRAHFLLTSVAAGAIVATAGLTIGSAFASSPPSSPAAASSPSTPSIPTPAKPAAANTAPDAKLPKNPTLAQVQAAAATDISNRVTLLKTAISKVGAATDLGSDQAPLVSNLEGDVTGLQQLGASIAGDTSLPTAITSYKLIFSNFRIYALALPATRLVLADDRALNRAAPALTKRAARLASKETPANQAEVQPLLADLATQVTAASTALNGQTAALEGFTAAEWNANHHLLTTPRADAKGAVKELAKARADAKQAASAIRHS